MDEGIGENDSNNIDENIVEDDSNNITIRSPNNNIENNRSPFVTPPPPSPLGISEQIHDESNDSLTVEEVGGEAILVEKLFWKNKMMKILNRLIIQMVILRYLKVGV